MTQNVAVTVALVKDTFREAFARKVFWGFCGLSTLCILFFLFILKIDLVEGAMATVSLFGHAAGQAIDPAGFVRLVCGGIAVFLYTWGLALAVFASGSLVPGLLEPGRIELLLSKPLSRAHLLLGRYLGILLVVAANIVWLVAGLWVILGLKTRIWDPAFLVACASALFIFAVMLGLITLLGVLWESAALSVMVPVALMLLSPILAQGKFAGRLLNSEWSRQLYRGIYHVLPKVYDLGHMTLQIARRQPLPEGAWLAVATTALFGCATLAGGLWVFSRRDF
jgi:ABC-type transport system involved in multi-copper enzyme maturation permease subunit